MFIYDQHHIATFFNFILSRTFIFSVFFFVIHLQNHHVHPSDQFIFFKNHLIIHLNDTIPIPTSYHHISPSSDHIIISLHYITTSHHILTSSSPSPHHITTSHHIIPSQRCGGVWVRAAAGQRRGGVAADGGAAREYAERTQ